MTTGSDDHVGRTLTDVLGFADEVRDYVIAPGEQNLYEDRQAQLVAEALIHRIGEAVTRLPEDFTDAHPDVSWRQMKRMRNVVAHEYGYIDYRIVWRALHRDLPQDVAVIERILQSRR